MDREVRGAIVHLACWRTPTNLWQVLTTNGWMRNGIGMRRAKTSPLHPKSANARDAEIGRLVRAQRRQLGMTQTDLAERIGVTFQQVQNYEIGRIRITIGRSRGSPRLWMCRRHSSLAERPRRPSPSARNLTSCWPRAARCHSCDGHASHWCSLCFLQRPECIAELNVG
jgi:DNA-binding XRE family transcriptional regulator